MNTPKRPRGRPPLDEADPAVSLTLRIPGKQLAAVGARARDDRIPLQEWIRRTLRDAAGDLKTFK